MTLASFQSPFAPTYSTIGLLWATTLIAVELRRARGAVALIALWPGLLFVPLGQSLEVYSAVSITQMTLAIGVSAWLAARAPRRVEA